MFFSFAGSMKVSFFIPDFLLEAGAVLRPRIGAGSPHPLAAFASATALAMG